MEKMLKPPALAKGDTIGIIAPARSITEKELAWAVAMIRNRGFQVVFGKHLFSRCHQFAGSDTERALDFQEMIENPDVKAVLAARGGYGCIRIVDKIDFTPLLNHPKWIIGYSDLTVFHNHLNHLGMETLHATMPINFKENSPDALQSLFDAIEGKPLSYTFANRYKKNREGIMQGELVGGNLSVLYSLLGSRSFPKTINTILFLEDLDEHLYHIDRMMLAMKRAGALNHLSGLLIGAFKKMHNRGVPFGKKAYEIIAETVKDTNYPVAFGFPAGHQPDNRALIMGRTATVAVKKSLGTLTFE